MITVWKYNVLMAQGFEIEMPFNAQVLSVQMQDDAPCMWVKVDTAEPLVSRSFAIVGTGNVVPQGYEHGYVDTWQQGRFVFHLFEPSRKMPCIHKFELGHCVRCNHPQHAMDVPR